MRRIALVLLCFAAALSLSAKSYEISGPQGGISYRISLPEGFEKP